MCETKDFKSDFNGIPPFPNNVPTAPLLRLSLEKLVNGDVGEDRRLWHACTEIGFFYLDLAFGSHSHSSKVNGHASNHDDSSQADSTQAHDIDNRRFLSDAERLFQVANEVFALPVGEKAQYDLKDKGSYFGYKGYGSGVVDAVGTKDRNEFYNIAKDDMLGLSEPLPAPELINGYRPLLSSYIMNAHAIVALILHRLDILLGLRSNAAVADGTLPSLHKLQARSGDQVRFVRSPPQPVDDRQTALGAHTDFGSVTLLFNKLGGLQVLPPPGTVPDGDKSDDGWMYVRPLPGHCIVNLGDALVKLTGGLLRSATHRVLNPPGEEQGALVRTSLVYFARPEDPVNLTPLRGRGSSLIDDATKEREARGEVDEVVTAKEWTLRRGLGRRGVGDWSKSGGTETIAAR